MQCPPLKYLFLENHLKDVSEDLEFIAQKYDKSESIDENSTYDNINDTMLSFQSEESYVNGANKNQMIE